ncbi:unnamed protein product [Cyclocybe aegerita]|uniref:Uncharacterized protein n=1 Tax=Cyclocybe aegerita TaxID=1973307 RepID=A0A8S0WBJ5_CYCAE|nr:unnamed protein product [Cyclocybe aegerita]
MSLASSRTSNIAKERYLLGAAGAAYVQVEEWCELLPITRHSRVDKSTIILSPPPPVLLLEFCCAMFKLIRRISYGVIPRPDRPWEEDATSNAPRKTRKRRLSSTEREAAGDDEQANKKKIRGDSATPSVADAEGVFLTPAPQADTQEVKEVTQGVEEVDLDGRAPNKEAAQGEEAAPESIPLPEEQSGELDEPTTDATSLATVISSSEEAEPPKDEPSITADDASDVASSSGEDATLSEKGKPSEDLKASTSPAVEVTAVKPIQHD